MSARLMVLGTAVAASLCLPAPARAVESTCDTYISALPYTISASGHYCLSKSLNYASSTGAAITIDAKSVVLDLKGFKLGGGAAGLATQAIGVFVVNHSFVTVRNGVVRGFADGVYFFQGSDNNNNVVEGITADANTVTGIVSLSPGSHLTVRDCTVTNTGGSTSIPNAAFGIGIDNTSSFVTDSTVINTFPTAGNTTRWGISVVDGMAVNNRVIGDGGATGINGCLTVATGFYKDNIVTKCVTSYSGGTPVGTTNYP